MTKKEFLDQLKEIIERDRIIDMNIFNIIGDIEELIEEYEKGG